LIVKSEGSFVLHVLCKIIIKERKMSAIITNIISNLDAPRSLLPFFVKDSFDVAGRTVMAQNEGGKHEAREKFIEEAGTSLFWIGGIPAVRWLSDKIAKGKLDTDIHFKRINTNGIQGYFADELIGKNKFSKESLNGIELGGKNLNAIKAKLLQADYIPNKTTGIYGKYNVGATFAAVAFNFLMLTFALPNFNQYLSRKIISKEAKAKQLDAIQPQEESLNFGSNKPNFNDFLTKTKELNGKNSPSFGSLKDMFNFVKIAENSQLNPTNSMLLLDYGISGSRITYVPRDNNERIEYIVKEGGIIMFFYYAADWIKKGFETLANKVFKTPIDLDYKILTYKDFISKIKQANQNADTFNFAGEKANEIDVIKFIDKELSTSSKDAATTKNAVLKNFTLQMAQKEGLIDIEYDEGLNKWIRHSKKYIETDKLINLNNNLKNFYQKSVDSGLNLDKFITKTKSAKALSVFGNMALCCLSLSFILPKIQYAIREHRTQTKEAPGIKVYEELAKEHKI